MIHFDPKMYQSKKTIKIFLSDFGRYTFCLYTSIECPIFAHEIERKRCIDQNRTKNTKNIFIGFLNIDTFLDQNV